MNGDWRHTVFGLNQQLRVDINLLAVTHGPAWNRTWKREEEFKMLLLRISGSTLFQGTLHFQIWPQPTPILWFVPTTSNSVYALAMVSIIFYWLHWKWLTRTSSGYTGRAVFPIYYVLSSLPDLEYSYFCFNRSHVMKVKKKKKEQKGIFCVFLQTPTPIQTKWMPYRHKW